MHQRAHAGDVFSDAPFIGAKPIQNHYTQFHILHCSTQKTEEGRNMLNIFEYEGMERTFRRNMKEMWTNMESWGHRAGPNGSCWGRNPGTSQVSWGTWFPTDRMIQGWEMFRFGCCDSFFWIVLFRPLKLDLGYILSRFFKRASVFSYFPIVLPFCNLAGPFENPVRRWVRLREKAHCSGTFFRSVSFVFFEELPFSSSSFRSWCVWHLDMLRHVLISFILQNCLFILKICPYFFQISLRSISPFCSLSGFSACSRRVSSRNFHPHEGFQCPSRRGARSWRSLGDIKPGNVGDETMKAADWAFFWLKQTQWTQQYHTTYTITNKNLYKIKINQQWKRLQ